MFDKTLNTIGGPWAENRGRRNASEEIAKRENNPFTSGERSNWKGFGPPSWRAKGQKAHGGALIGHDGGTFEGKGPRNYARSDTRIYEEACELLTSSDSVDATEIEVEVSSGILYLRGTVQSESMKRQAQAEVENVPGVTDVQNLLRVA